MTLTATAAMPYEHLERATAGLRGQLRELAAAADAVPDWTTLTVTGPAQDVGAHGRIWYRWTATVLAETAD